MTWSAFLPTFGFLFVVVMLRANATYWLGRGASAGSRRYLRLGEGGHSPRWVRARDLINRWGPLAVVFCFLTVGLQTADLVAAGHGHRVLLSCNAIGVAISAAIFTALSAETGPVNWIEGVIPFVGRQDNLAVREAALFGYCSHRTSAIGPLPDRAEVILGGMIGALKFSHTKNPKPGQPSKYVMFDLEDVDGPIRCILWPNDFAKFGDLVQPEAA